MQIALKKISGVQSITNYEGHEVVMMMVLMEMLMKRPAPTSRSSGDDDGGDSPLTRAFGAVGFALSRSRRGISPTLPPL
jgi:hypothetical protein